MQGNTFSEISFCVKYSLHAMTARSADRRQGVKGSFIDRVNAGKINFCLDISDKLGATFPMKITVFVRMLASWSDCNRTKYRTNFSKFAWCNFGTNTIVDFRVNSRSAALESEKPEHMGSKTWVFTEALSSWLSSREIFWRTAPRTPRSLTPKRMGTSGVMWRWNSSGFFVKNDSAIWKRSGTMARISLRFTSCAMALSLPATPLILKINSGKILCTATSSLKTPRFKISGKLCKNIIFSSAGLAVTSSKNSCAIT
mmetsp:Transcript_20153/g.40700  ORF Transcript_20153/g.40700 Transcript_20153/m.40700 type:complete len:256 (-) Transcript_20153:633-1400(-)